MSVVAFLGMPAGAEVLMILLLMLLPLAFVTFVVWALLRLLQQTAPR